MLIIKRLLFFIIFSALFLSFKIKIYDEQLSSQSKPLKIVTSFSILHNFMEQIIHGTSHIELLTIVPPLADPHTYQPTPQDSIILSKAHLIFINGLGFEKLIERLIDSSGYKGCVYEVAEQVKSRPDILDPHTWHNVHNAILYVKKMTEVLIQHDLQYKELYIKNSSKLIEKLQTLHQWVQEQFNSIPLNKRIIITTHDAFWYFGQAYNLKFLSPVGISTEAEASPQDIARLIKLIKEENIKAIFMENLAKPQLLRQIAEETECPLKGILYADSLSLPDGPASDYISMIKHNVQTILEAFQ